MRSLLRGVFLGMLLFGAALHSSLAQPWRDHGPLRVSSNQRYLQHRDGTPFLWLGDTAWALFCKLNREDVRIDLDDRQGKGFTVIQAVAYWYPHGEDGPGPHNAPNACGHRPFQGPEDAPQTDQPRVISGGSPGEPDDSYAATWIWPDTGERAPVVSKPGPSYAPPADWPDALLSLDARPRMAVTTDIKIP